MRVLQAPLNIANQGWMNAEALRLRGHEAEVWQFGESTFGYPADRVFTDFGHPGAIVENLLEAIGRRFDVVHFHFAQSLVPPVGPLPWMWDLPMWKALGVRIVFSFHGTDIRIARIAKKLDPWSAYHFAEIPCDEDRIEDALAVIRGFADGYTISNVANRPYFPEADYLPLSVDLREIPESVWHHIPGKQLVVAHAPSARGTKGTEFVLKAFDKLRREGLKFEVDLIEGATNREVLERYARADVVVEKLVNEGFGVAALEAMAVGRPVVSRVAAMVYDVHPSLPIIDATPESFADVLRDLLGDPAEIGRRASLGRPYVRDNHDIALTGERLETLYSHPSAQGEQIYPGWPVPRRDRRVSELQARVHELRMLAQAKSSDHLLAVSEDPAAEVRRLNAQVGALRAANRVLERECGEARHSPWHRVARRLRRAARAVRPWRR